MLYSTLLLERKLIFENSCASHDANTKMYTFRLDIFHQLQKHTHVRDKEVTYNRVFKYKYPIIYKYKKSFFFLYLSSLLNLKFKNYISHFNLILLLENKNTIG